MSFLLHQTGNRWRHADSDVASAQRGLKWRRDICSGEFSKLHIYIILLMEEILHHLIGILLSLFAMLWIAGGAGFLPSTLSFKYALACAGFGPCLPQPTPSPSKTPPRIHMEGRVDDVLLPRVSEQYLDKGSKKHMVSKWLVTPMLRHTLDGVFFTILNAITGSLYFCSATFGNSGRTFYSWYYSPLFLWGGSNLHHLQLRCMSPCPPWTPLMWWCVHPGKACQTWEGHARMGILAKRLGRQVNK